MKYKDLIKHARGLGLTVGRPKKTELEAMVVKIEEERTAQNDPVQLRDRAARLRKQMDTLETEAMEAEERATAIEAAQIEYNSALGGLRSSFSRLLNAVERMFGLELTAKLPTPLTVPDLRRIIAELAPPTRIYAFWFEGQHKVARGYVIAETFEIARDHYLKGEVDYGTSWIHLNWCDSGKKEAHRAIETLTEGGNFKSIAYNTVLYTETLPPHLYLFSLDGPEYAGKTMVAANSFDEAKGMVMSGQILEGDTLEEMEEEDKAELQKAMNSLSERGRVEHLDHILVSMTII